MPSLLGRSDSFAFIFKNDTNEMEAQLQVVTWPFVRNPDCKLRLELLSMGSDLRSEHDSATEAVASGRRFVVHAFFRMKIQLQYSNFSAWMIATKMDVFSNPGHT